MPELTPYNCFVAPLLLITPALLDSVLTDVIAANAVYIEDLNRKQLNQGIRADGSAITPYYKPQTVEIKREKGQLTDRVRLYDTGDFYESIFVEVFEDAFDLDATDEKTAALKAKYGSDILGLTADNKRILADYLKPQFVTQLKTRIGL